MWWRVKMTTRTVIFVLLVGLFTVGTATADQTPFERAKPLQVDFKNKSQVSAAVSAAASLPYVLIRERVGGVYWLLDLETLDVHFITSSASGDKRVSAAHWGSNYVALFSSYGRYLKRIDPENPSQAKEIPAELQSSPLRSFTWLSDQEVLIDEVTPYVIRDGALTP